MINDGRGPPEAVSVFAWVVVLALPPRSILARALRFICFEQRQAARNAVGGSCAWRIGDGQKSGGTAPKSKNGSRNAY